MDPAVPEGIIHGIDSGSIPFLCLDHTGLSFHHSKLKENSAIKESPESPRILVQSRALCPMLPFVLLSLSYVGVRKVESKGRDPGWAGISLQTSPGPSSKGQSI